MFNQVLSHINWLHVAVAAIAYFAIGFIWYSSVLFGKKWIKITNTNMDDKSGMFVIFAGSFILMFVISTGMAVLQQVLPAIDLEGGMKLGLLVGIMISVASISINYLYTKKPFALYLIDGFYHVIGITVASSILSAWH